MGNGLKISIQLRGFPVQLIKSWNKYSQKRKLQQKPPRMNKTSKQLEVGTKMSLFFCSIQSKIDLEFCHLNFFFSAALTLVHSFSKGPYKRPEEPRI